MPARCSIPIHLLGVILDDLAVRDPHNAPGRGGDPVVMGDENDGAALLVQLLEEAQHLVARPGIQCAGRLIRQQDRRHCIQQIFYQRNIKIKLIVK